MRKGVVWKLVTAIYEKLRKSKFSMILFPTQVKKDLQSLNKEEDSYYKQKFMQLFWICLLFLFVVGFGIRNVYITRSSQVKTIERPKAAEESEEITLKVVDGEAYTFEISPRILTEEEAEVLFKEFLPKLECFILGANQNVMEITDNLVFPDSLQGYPFTIYWESEKEQIIDDIGNVYREHLKSDELVIITATCTYMDYQWEAEFCVQVLREDLPEEERYKRELGLYLSEDEKNNRYSEVWKLPDKFEGASIQYREVPKWDKLIVLGGLILVTGILLWLGTDKDLHQARKKRQDIFEEEYLNFVSSLSLYISAGLNLQTAMKHCVKDYAHKKPAGDMIRELLLCFEKDISNGYSFQASLEMFADRTDHIYYKRLAGLLQQGLLNGTNDLVRTLRQEVEKMREDKRRQSKIKGEKMSSALIAPMLLQLCIVMAVIMLPAFSNMQF